jgi:CelD/BcsL family acetyltransferase involved in cellulose biosynthesis
MRVERLEAVTAEAHAAAWQDLARRCLEPNVFLEPGFALAAAKHLAKGAAPNFLFVWDDAKPESELIAVCPLARQTGLGRFLPQRLWTHDQAPLGTPLLDRARAANALSALFAYARNEMPEAGGLMFPMLLQEGEFARLLTQSAASEGRPIEIFGAHTRAVVSAGQDPERYFEQAITSGRRRKLRRARKMLEARGAVTLRVLRGPEEIRAGAEDFLALESKGWKGRRGTALLKSPERTTFVRDVVAAFADTQRYFVLSLDFDGKPIAMAFVFTSGDRAFFWKTAYDEDFATYSPGVLSILELTDILLRDPTIALTDSCAAGDNPMYYNVWAEYAPVADLFVCLDTDQTKKFASLARREALYRNLRQKLKTVVNKVRRGVQAASANFSFVVSKAKSSQGVSVSTSEVSTVGPHQTRKPGGASRCAPMS